MLYFTKFIKFAVFEETTNKNFLKFTENVLVAPNFLFFSLRQIKSAPNLENMWLRKIKSAPKTSFLPGAKFNPNKVACIAMSAASHIKGAMNRSFYIRYIRTLSLTRRYDVEIW